ncbi:hypothetical protein MRB53_028461 [Persea americana]|uniref:Uncharacterized protein n=1 Tax=Persea americana TaxID=3435 RepID=A0ACC2KFK6_PERAE|nr:hypothetical protein MRB53_028461 [Persea americana]
MASPALFLLLHLDRWITQVREQEMHGRSENFRRSVDFRSEVLNKESKGSRALHRREPEAAQSNEEPEVEKEAEEAEVLEENGQPEDAGDIGARDEDAENIEPTIGLFPGGPVNFIVLPSFRNQIVAATWNGEVRLPLKCINHDQNIRNWPQNVNGAPINIFRDFVVRPGLSRD